MSRVLTLVLAVVAVAALIFTLFVRGGAPEEVARLPVAPIAPAAPIVSQIPHQIQPGETLGQILQNFGIKAMEVRKAALPITDLARIRAGRILTFTVTDQEPMPREIRYPMGEDKTLVLLRNEAGWTARLDEVQYTVSQAVREFTVNTSFWAAAVEAGLRARDIAGLAQVYRYDVDFNTEIRQGATVRMIVEELYESGKFAKLGHPLAVRFSNGGKEYTAIHHVQSDGTEGYYDDKGIARKKAFLRSPLKFSRVTSGFARKRFHPILKRNRAHLGVDFRAKSGTPVYASGSGVVSFAGRKGGHGKHVKLNHTGPYASSYSHLSKIKVKRGQKVRQGQLVGLVGSTGMSTGPHLHYQFWVHNKIVNPMKVKLPRSQPLPTKERTAFRAQRDSWLERLDATGPALAEG